MCEDLLTHVDKKGQAVVCISGHRVGLSGQKKKLIDIGFRLGSSMDRGNHVMDGLTRG